MTLVAGIDSSTQSCKILICDSATGDVVRQASTPHPAGTEVDPQHWWDALQTTIEQAGGLDDVTALSIGGQQHGMVCLDAQGNVIRPALLWNDTRSASSAADLILEAGQGDIESGKHWWADAVGSVPVASLTITKLRWLADNEPDNVAKIAAICLPHDYLTWKFKGTGDLNDLVTDRSDASGTGYMDGSTAQYRYDLLVNALRIPLEQARSIILPRILSPFEAHGTGDPSRNWGHIHVGPGCGDNAGAALGLQLEPGQACLSIGTSGVLSVVSEVPAMDPSGSVNGFHDASGHYLPLACTLNGAQILDNTAKLLGVSHDELADLALSAPVGAQGITLVPYFAGERTPNLPNATATFAGLTMENYTRANIARAACEGLFGLLAGALQAVENLGAPITSLAMVGGATASAAVRAIAPTCINAAITIPGESELVARGAARQAAALATGQAPAWKRAPSVALEGEFQPLLMERYTKIAQAMLPLNQ